MYTFNKRGTAARYIRRTLIEYGLKPEIAYGIPMSFYEDMGELVCETLSIREVPPNMNKSDMLIRSCQGTAMNIISTIQKDPQNSCDYVIDIFNKHGITI